MMGARRASAWMLQRPIGYSFAGAEFHDPSAVLPVMGWWVWLPRQRPLLGRRRTSAGRLVLTERMVV
eukprot:5058574-Lingulodinium_polyedra.AAC.1